MTEFSDKLGIEQLGKLILVSLDGSASGQQITELNEILRSSSKACDFYFEFIETYTVIRKISANAQCTADDSVQPIDSHVSFRAVEVQDIMLGTSQVTAEDPYVTGEMLELLEMERNAPSVDIPKEELEELNQKDVCPARNKIKLNKFQKFVYAACAAVIIAFAMFVIFVPERVVLPIVAELADTINATWDDELQVPDEFGYMAQSKYRLKEGFASIIFIGGAKITVEAPAEFSLHSAGDMELIKGSIYAIVPEHAHGFTVTACGNKIVDLGTEFGIEVDKSSNTQLHVTKGRTLLFAGLPGGKKTEVKVDVGAAKKIYNDGLIMDVDLVANKFARKIDSSTGKIDRGPINIPIVNSGFEDKALADGSFSSTVGGWIEGYYGVKTGKWYVWDVPATVREAGVINPDIAYGYGGKVPEGENVGFSPVYNADEWGSETVGLSQSLSATLQMNTQYDLSVMVGAPGANSGLTVEYRIELLAGEILLDSITGKAATPNQWSTVNLSYTSDTSAASYLTIGQPLTIRLLTVYKKVTDTLEVNFDAVKLTYIKN